MLLQLLDLKKSLLYVLTYFVHSRIENSLALLVRNYL